MIQNDQQLRVTRDSLGLLQEGLNKTIDYGVGDLDPLIHIAVIEGIRSQIVVLEKEVEEYLNQVIIAYGMGNRELPPSDEGELLEMD